MKYFLILAIVTFGLSFESQALNIKEKKQLKAWKQYMDDPSQSYGKWFKDKCGYDLPVVIDEGLVKPFMAANTSAASYCDSPRSVMQAMCGDKDMKEIVLPEFKKKIKKVVCKMSNDKELTLKIEKGALTMMVKPGTSNLDKKVKDFLENNL